MAALSAAPWNLQLRKQHVVNRNTEAKSGEGQQHGKAAIAEPGQGRKGAAAIDHGTHAEDHATG
jgi:hypothetical protein